MEVYKTPITNSYGDYIECHLSSGIAVFDNIPQVHELLRDHCFHIGLNHKTRYVFANIRKAQDQSHTTTTFHLLLYKNLGIHVPQGYVIDHIDGDGANNRLCNLRIVTKSANSINRTNPQRNNTSGVPGVSRHTGKYERWDVRWMTADGKRLTRSFSFLKYGGCKQAKIEAMKHRDHVIKTVPLYKDNQKIYKC